MSVDDLCCFDGYLPTIPFAFGHGGLSHFLGYLPGGSWVHLLSTTRHYMFCISWEIWVGKLHLLFVVSIHDDLLSVSDGGDSRCL